MRGTEPAQRDVGRPRVDAPRQRWAWSVPPLAAFLVMFAAPFGLLGQLLALTLAVPVVVVAARRPGGALLALIVFLPLQRYVVAVVYRFGVPVAGARGLGWLKEALVLGIVLSAIHAARRAGRRMDVVDKIALVWLAGLTLYLLLPQVLSAAGAPTGLNVRLQGFRANAAFVILLLAVRHAPMPARILQSFQRVLIAMAALVAVLGIYQFIDPDGWIRFTYDVARVPTYQYEVLGPSLQQAHLQFLWLFETPVRVGSVLISPFEFVDLMLIGLALVLVRLVRTGVRAPTVLALGAMSFALVASRTRSTLLAAALVGVVLLRPGIGRITEVRVRLAVLAVLGILVVAPFQIGTRITGGEGGSVSSAAHVVEFSTGLRHLIEEPIGRGLGTAPGVGTRFEVPGSYISGNAYLQVGNELGLIMMIVFIVLLVVVLRALHAVPPDHAAAGLAQAIWAAGIGLCLAGMLHHVWLSIPVAWVFFAGAGLALSVHRTSAPEPSGPVRRGLGHPS